MYAIDKIRLQMFRRVRDLVRSGPVAPEFEKSLTNFEATIDRLTEIAVQQEFQRHLTLASTQRARLLALRLRTELMKPVVGIGRSFLPSTGDEGETIRRALALRPATDYEGLIQTAEGMALLVAQHEAQFTEAGLPVGHAKQLTQVSGELRAAIDARGQEMGKRTAATSGARQATREAVLQLRILSTLVVPRFRSDAQWMASWRTAMVVARRGMRGGAGEVAGGLVEGGQVAVTNDSPAPEVKAA